MPKRILAEDRVYPSNGACPRRRQSQTSRFAVSSNRPGYRSLNSLPLVEEIARIIVSVGWLLIS